MAEGSPTGGAPANTGADGGAVATGQGTNPTDQAATTGTVGGDVTPGQGEVGRQQVAAPAPKTTGAGIDPRDGEPIPVGNEAQRKAAEAFRATIPKPAKQEQQKTLKEQTPTETEKK